MSFNPGDLILNKYRLDAYIGAGAFAQVYRATHLALNAPRALKILQRGAPGVGSQNFEDTRQRFHLEAQLGAAIEHPNVIRVYDFEDRADLLVLVMELAPGGNLKTRLDTARAAKQAIPLDECVRITLDLANGLTAIHAQEAVHRDVKPSNILFDDKGNAKIADLGLAQIPGGPSMRSILSDTLLHPGTPAYMSPEQAHARTHLAPASDVFAVGCILFEMLTGRMYRNVKPGTLVRELRGDIPEWLNDAVMRMLAKEAEARLWDGAEVVEALREAGEKTERERIERENVKREAEAQAERENVKRKAEARAERERIERENAKHKQAEAKARREKAEREEREQQERIRREQELRLTLAPNVPLELVRVPAGEFMMGTTPNQAQAVLEQNYWMEAWVKVEQPQHRIWLDEYLMGKAPITVGQFAEFVQATGYQTTAEKQGSGWNWMGSEEQEIPGANWQHPHGPQSNVAQKAQHPVSLVSWDDAMAFCDWASQITHRKISLPTEAQWEKAARGTDGRLYPWGNNVPDANLCNYNLIVKDTTPVGKYSPGGNSPYGCVDMAGNVWEWCADWFDLMCYQEISAENPMGPASGGQRVLRGGAFYNSATIVRCACRYWYGEYYHYGYGGFRVCALPSTSTLSERSEGI